MVEFAKLGFSWLLVCLAGTISAHPVSMVDAVAHVEDRTVRVAVKIFPEDYTFFQGVRPDGKGFIAKHVLEASITAHKTYIEDHFFIYDRTGTRLRGELAKIDRFEIGDEGFPARELMDRFVTYHFVYDLSEKPKYLTFSQTFGSGSPFPALFDLVVEQPGAGALPATRINQAQPLYTVRFAHGAGSQLQAAELHRPWAEIRRDAGNIVFSLVVPRNAIMDPSAFVVTHQGRSLEKTAAVSYLLDPQFDAPRKWTGKKLDHLTERTLHEATYALPKGAETLSIKWLVAAGDTTELPLYVGAEAATREGRKAFLTQFRPEFLWHLKQKPSV